MTRSVKGKSALVTGAGSGINLEFARLLLQAGCNVLIADLSLRPEAQDLVNAHSNSSSSSAKAIFHKTDVSSWSDLKSAFDAALQHFTTLDIVCPGAGVFEPPWSGFWYPPGSANSKDTLESNNYKSLEIDLVHPIRVTQMAISHFLASSSNTNTSSNNNENNNLKTVVHIASIAAELSFGAIPLYNASKWGLRGFIYCFAGSEFETQRNIRVSGVAPAIVKTPIWLDHPDKKKMVSDDQGNLQDDWVTPEEVAKVMLAICQEDEMETAKGGKVSLRSGSLVEVVHEDVRDVPMFGNLAPGTGTEGKGLATVGMERAFDWMHDALGTEGWGKF